ncbi:hypothetical protein SDC9_204374 [bioreactor metagenome]|uniref:DUF2179 domain-containing protein n=1 Tax=bioreactor metagenome TaxID=1076179 RepID=A0A645J8A3_9ZZZZ
MTTQLIDLIQEGPSSSKAFMIVTAVPDQVAQAILAELERGVTFLQGRGAYTGQMRETLLCVVSTSEVTMLKELIYNLDKSAFVIVADVHEVLGEGFSRTK